MNVFGHAIYNVVCHFYCFGCGTTQEAFRGPKPSNEEEKKIIYIYKEVPFFAE
jgi:hypothetical protein